jgi:predicted TIM-barrel fold metal-dependent hydrolase
LITDTNVSLSRWPFRRLAGDEPADTVARLRKRNVTQAWAGSFDALLHEDIAGVNARLAADCRRYGDGFLLPFGTINVRLPDWKEDLRRCVEEHRMRGVRLHPNYQGFAITDPAFVELLGLAAVRDLVVQIAVGMEDERTQNPLVRVADVPLAPLVDIVKKVPGVRLQILNARSLNPELFAKLTAASDVFCDISIVEGVHGVARLMKQAPERVVFGSRFPLFYFESSLLKLQEAGLTEDQRRLVLTGNAARLLSGGKPR